MLHARQLLDIGGCLLNLRSDQWRQSSNDGLDMKHSPTSLAQPFSKMGLQETICASLLLVSC